MREIIEKYKKHLAVDGKSDSTIINYIFQIDNFLREISLEDISKETIENYIFNLKDKFSPNTLNICKSSIRNFLLFLGKDNIVVPKNFKRIKRLPEFVTLQYFENDIIPMIETIFVKALKYKTLFHFMYFTGLRLGEIPLLTRANFDLKNLKIKVFSQKTKRERIIPCTKKVAQLLDQYFSLEPEIKNAFNINKKGIEDIFRRLQPYFKDINLHPHIFRHSYATHLRKLGISIEDIQYLLGHASISSTMIYAHADVSNILEKFHKKIK